MKLYSITTRNIENMPVKERIITIGVLCSQPGYKAYCPLKTKDAMLWLYDSSKSAEDARTMATAATINCGENICRFDWDEKVNSSEEHKGGEFMQQTKHERNQAILNDYMIYKSYRAVAKLYGLSTERTRQIIKRTNAIIKPDIPESEDAKMYKAITSLPMSETHSHRLYYALKRIDVNTLDKLRQYSIRTLSGKKNIGAAALKALADAKYIKGEEQ